MTLQKSREWFDLPMYQELPAMGLYLKQVVTYLQQSVAPFESVTITDSMVSNYVKHRLISRPQNRQYSRDQLAQLLFIVVAKNVLEQNNLRKAIRIQQASYQTEVAYNYFVQELGNVARYVFGQQTTLEHVGQEHTKQKQMLRNVIMAFVYREYLYQFFDQVEAN
ncbi:DUF1836 domain-containing protein [uncultured Limosilactobacillus sp.]|uniref:DUF1836 domain-containing protein n=1 Tax=uncultured Limosilactobacillus sp. TaxID=2837629 RepID=UPI0025E5F0B4|nr:DUF1836 domain-containing protein [uncultured Limosilactobacillus sp.]